MKPSVCLVCLMTFNGDDLASEEGNAGIPFDVPLLKRFLKFAKNYLNLSSVTTQQLLLSGSDRKDVFCEKCELSVINPICQIYLELLSAQLRLSSELEQLGKLIDNSRVSGSDKLRVLNINALSHQLGIRSLSQLEEFRVSLAQKCRLRRKQALPDVLLSPQFEEDETGAMENDEPSIQDNLEQVRLEPCAREATDNNSVDLKLFGPIGSGEAPIGTVIQFKTFKKDSNPELIFENENDEEINDSPSELSAQVFPVAQNAGLRINGVYYNGRRCPKCLKVLKNENQYHIHYRYHHVAIACNTCGKTFGNQKSLREHTNRFHQKQGIYTCQVCSKVFETPYKLNVHMRYVHVNKDRPYHCPDCKATFKRISNLEQHISAMHKPGSYKCPHCPEIESKIFSTEKYLRGHIRRVHPQEIMFPKSANTVLYANVASSESHTSAEMST